MSTKDIVLLVQSSQTVIDNVCDLSILAYDFHSKSKKLCIVLNNELFELQSVQPRKFGSWFINQKISSSKQFYMASKFDARFLCLKHFETSPVRFSPLNQTIVLQDGLATFCLSNANKLKLEEICDVNDKIDDEIVFYKYNAAKTLVWLQEKVKRLSSVLYKQRLERAASATFVNNFDASKQSRVKVDSTEGNSNKEPQQEDIKQALDILSEYLSEDTFNKLLEAFGLSKTDLKPVKVVESNKRKADWEIELELEKETLMFSSTATTVPDARPAAKAAAPTVASSAATKAANAVNKVAKVNAQAAKGTKSINSFFSKPA